MARYIDADQLIKKIYPMGIGDGKYTINAKAVKLAIDNAPTADVVPKSEVESIITEIADFIWQGESEKMNFPFNNHYYNKQEFIAELKKKYTGDRDD